MLAVVTAIPNEIHRFSSATTQSVPMAGGPVFGVKIIDTRPKLGSQIIDSYGTVDVEVGFQDPLSPVVASMVNILQQIGNKVEDIIFRSRAKSYFLFLSERFAY